MSEDTEGRSVTLTLHELLVAVDALDAYYVKMIRKTAKLDKQRHAKTLDRMKTCQVALQKLARAVKHPFPENVTFGADVQDLRK